MSVNQVSNGKIKTFRDLDIWQLGKCIATDVYRVTSTFPDREVYGLISQMRRAAISITSNIAEGYYRWHNNEYRRFLYMALGSCGELESQVEICRELDLIPEPVRQQLIEKLDHEIRMIRNLIKKVTAKSLAESKRPQPELPT